jgi:basic membrane protein A and related proteins
MDKKKSILILVSLMMAFALVLGACQPQTIIETVEVEKIVEVEKEVEVVKEVEVEVEKEVIVEVEKENMADNFKFAVVLPGVITDADYNTLGYIAMTAVQNEVGVESAYSESVPVPDVQRVLREYIDAGFNVIFVHGAQFNTASLELAPEFPDVAFILEGDGPLAEPLDNVWMIDRNFHNGYYVIGYIAAKSSASGKIGYLSGLTLAFSYQELHAMEQAWADMGVSPEVTSVWTGDFNDPTKARQVADQMIADGVDYIAGSQNLGMFGIFEAAKAASTEDSKILVSAKYTDKTSFAPDNYVTSVLYDYATPMVEIVQKVIAGEMSGYYPIQFGKGSTIQLPLKNVDPALEAEVQQVIDDINSGAIEVVKDSSAVE